MRQGDTHTHNVTIFIVQIIIYFHLVSVLLHSCCITLISLSTSSFTDAGNRNIIVTMVINTLQCRLKTILIYFRSLMLVYSYCLTLTLDVSISGLQRDYFVSFLHLATWKRILFPYRSPWRVIKMHRPFIFRSTRLPHKGKNYFHGNQLSNSFNSLFLRKGGDFLYWPQQQSPK